MTNKDNILARLTKASSLLTSTLEIKELLPQVMEIAKSLLECEAASVLLIDEENKHLTFETALGEKGDAVKKLFLPLGQGIAGKVALEGNPIISNDVSKSKDFTDALDKKTGFQTKSVVCVPLKIKDKIIGVLEALNPYTKAYFDTIDMYLLSLFANQIVLSINSATLHKQILSQKRLEDQLNLAHTIQQNFLPRDFPQDKTFSFYGNTTSAYRIGGDFFDIFNLDGKRIGFTIGDVSGKGVPAALFMAMILSQLRFLSQKYSTSNNPALVLKELNSTLLERRSNNMFITLIYGIFFPETRKVLISSAAHNYPLRYSQNEKKWEEITLENGLPLGITDDADYTNKEITLSKGDTFLLCTDGISESEDINGHTFINDKLKDITPSEQEALPIGKTILQELTKFLNNAAPFDDSTIFILKLSN